MLSQNFPNCCLKKSPYKNYFFSTELPIYKFEEKENKISATLGTHKVTYEISRTLDDSSRFALYEKIYITELIKAGWIFIHGSAWIDPNSELNLQIGAQKSGKTRELIDACSKGSVYLADDVLLIDPQRRCHLYGRPVSIHLGHGVHFFIILLRTKLASVFAKNVLKSIIKLFRPKYSFTQKIDPRVLAKSTSDLQRNFLKIDSLNINAEEVFLDSEREIAQVNYLVSSDFIRGVYAQLLLNYRKIYHV